MSKRGAADDYYKFRISSFHEDDETVWAVGTWFYSPEDLKVLKLSSRYVLALSFLFFILG